MQTTFIKIENYRFDPQEVTVPIDTMVRWDNYGGVSHSLASYDAYDDSFDTGVIPAQQFSTIIFEKIATVRYWCTEHHEMGVIHVENQNTI